MYLHLHLYLYPHLPVMGCKARRGKGFRVLAWQQKRPLFKHSALLRQDAEYLPTCMVHLPAEGGDSSSSLGEVMREGV